MEILNTKIKERKKRKKERLVGNYPGPGAEPHVITTHMIFWTYASFRIDHMS